MRNHEDYRERVLLFGENPGNLEPVEYLVARSVKTLFNAFWGMPGVAVRSDFAKALKCVRILIDFHLMAQYGSHTTCTLDYMESYLDDFHKHKNIFLEFRAYKKTLKDARDRTKAVSGSQSTQQSLEEIWEIRERSHFNFIKLHVLMHYREHVERFGSIPQYSTDVSELAHVRQVNEAYRASNKVNAATQILDYGGR